MAFGSLGSSARKPLPYHALSILLKEVSSFVLIIKRINHIPYGIRYVFAEYLNFVSGLHYAYSMA